MNYEMTTEHKIKDKNNKTKIDVSKKRQEANKITYERKKR